MTMRWNGSNGCFEADIYRLLTVFTYTVSYSFYSLFWSRHLLITHSLSSSACSTSPPMFYITSPNLQFPLQSPTFLSADWGTVIMWWTIFCAFHLQIYPPSSHPFPTLKICPWHSIPSVKHVLEVPRLILNVSNIVRPDIFQLWTLF